MKFTLIDPPRIFSVGLSEIIQMKDCAHVELQPNEQITFVTASGAEYDVARKSWGFYATPSLNGRLLQFGLRGVLVKSPSSKFYLLLVEQGKETEFQRYLELESQTLVCWLDNDSQLEALEQALRDIPHAP